MFTIYCTKFMEEKMSMAWRTVGKKLTKNNVVEKTAAARNATGWRPVVSRKKTSTVTVIDDNRPYFPFHFHHSLPLRTLCDREKDTPLSLVVIAARRVCFTHTLFVILLPQSCAHLTQSAIFYTCVSMYIVILWKIINKIP